MSSIYDQALVMKWLRITRHLKSQPSAYEHNGLLTIKTKTQTIYIAKKSQKMRLKSQLDWVYYDPKLLSLSIDADLIDAYYEMMLTDPQSDPNIWKDQQFEMYLKSFYAARNNRAIMT